MMSKVKLTDELKREVYNKAERLIALHKEGALGGEIMPEDANPGLDRRSKENYLYFTLPMALNYQRNSYKLWEAAKLAYFDDTVSDIFIPASVLNMSEDELREKLVKHKVALQPNKHIEIWRTLCRTFEERFSGDVRELFRRNDYSVKKIKEFVLKNKKEFPYLSGPKILNYWLYVMLQYTDAVFIDRENIAVAPDTHVMQASVKLGLLSEEEANKADAREHVSELWNSVFENTQHCPIDIHTPLWLWSRNGFSVQIGDDQEEFVQWRQERQRMTY